MKQPRMRLAVSGLFLTSCVIVSLVHGQDLSTETPSVTESTDHIQPRVANERTVFQYEVRNEQGDMEPSGFSQKQVVQSHELDGQTIFRVRISDFDNVLDNLASLFSENDAVFVWEYFDEHGSYHWVEDETAPGPPGALSEFELSLPYPTTVGHRYTAFEDEHEVLSLSTSVTVPAGTFDAVVYQITYSSEEPQSRELFYQVPGLGMVKWESFLQVPTGWELQEVESLTEVPTRT
ncbi:MAG: hypothetical protein ACFCU3_06665 [Verrucomicrobiales bacterium]